MSQGSSTVSPSLAQRRAALVAQAQAQRTLLALQAEALETRLSMADAALRLLARVQRKPLVAAAVAAGIAAVVVRPRSAIRWLGYTATLLSLVGRIRALFQR